MTSLTSQGAIWEGPWLTSTGKLILPDSQALHILKAFHSSLRIGHRPILTFLHTFITHPHLCSLLAHITQACSICCLFNPQGAIRPPPSFPAHQACGHIPGQIGKLISLICHHRHRYLLTFLDTFSGWLEEGEHHV